MNLMFLKWSQMSFRKILSRSIRDGPEYDKMDFPEKGDFWT